MANFRKLIIVLAAMAVTASAQQPTPRQPAGTPARTVDGTSGAMWGDALSKGTGQRGEWLRDSRFAMFIHWGLYSELGGEWQGKTYYGISEWIMNRAKIPVHDYEQLALRFNPTGFNALEWVRTAKAAGMRRIMITAKHHEGFAMFGSKVSAFNIVDATPFHRDVMKELAAACQAEGIRLGFYYSQSQDWHERDAVGNTWDFPSAGNFPAYLERKAIPQITELLTNYGPIATIWFDTPGPITPAQSRELVDLVHRKQPQAIVNSRIGNGLGDYDTLGDMEIPRLPRAGLWETVDTHNDSWGYAINDINFKSAREIVERLVRVVSRGGVYMLNVGPDGKGRMPETSVRVLREVGQWVHAHENAIDGAGPSPLALLPWGECTTRGNLLFLHVFQWPADGRLQVPGLHSKILNARLGNTPLAVTQTSDGAIIRLPTVRPQGLIPVVTAVMSGEIKAERALYVLTGNANRLDAATAKLTGCKLEKVRWMEKFGDWHHEECAAGWQGPESSAAWEFRTTEPGSFRLSIEYTSPAEDDYSEWVVKLDGKRISFPMVDTGERAKRTAFAGALPRFRPYRIGLLQLAPGRHTLSIGPSATAGKATRIAYATLDSTH